MSRQRYCSANARDRGRGRCRKKLVDQATRSARDPYKGEECDIHGYLAALGSFRRSLVRQVEQARRVGGCTFLDDFWRISAIARNSLQRWPSKTPSFSRS